MADAVKVIDGAIAAFGADPVAWLHSDNGIGIPAITRSRNVADSWFSKGWNIKPLYTAPPAPVSVPAAMEMDDDFDSAFEHGKAVGWNACRTAMLQSFGNTEQLDEVGSWNNHMNTPTAQAANSPVTPDCWIKCSERMPEDEQEVLTRNRMGHCFVSFFDEHSGLFFDRVDVAAACCIEHILVTHWMPLPAAPQQEAE
ncbi:TPA: DUF551 domain-containing protein [Citrobacter freundii]|nr:DUF551 domain-containing protein [Citrobacter freundii]